MLLVEQIIISGTVTLHYSTNNADDFILFVLLKVLGCLRLALHIHYSSNKNGFPQEESIHYFYYFTGTNTYNILYWCQPTLHTAAAAAYHISVPVFFR